MEVTDQEKDAPGSLRLGGAGHGEARGGPKFSGFAPGLSFGVRPVFAGRSRCHVRINGFGFDAATPVARKLNIRAGGDFFDYSTHFQEQGANVAVNLQLRTGHASVDWFPWKSFRVSPMVEFANNNRVRATAVIPAGDTFSLSGQEYISSLTDPLLGSGSVDFRKTSPGFTVGFGNIRPPDITSVSSWNWGSTMSANPD
jgi:hypothetical protein